MYRPRLRLTSEPDVYRRIGIGLDLIARIAAKLDVLAVGAALPAVRAARASSGLRDELRFSALRCKDDVHLVLVQFLIVRRYRERILAAHDGSHDFREHAA